MNQTTRREFVKQVTAGAGGMGLAMLAGGAARRSASRKPSDIRIERISYRYEEHIFRAPLKFALTVVDRATLLHVECTVRTAAGKVATGFGINPLNYTFSYPSRRLSHEARLGAMKALAEQIARLTGAYQEWGHPIDINWELAPAYLRAAAEVSQRLQLADPIPKLCTLVTAAAFDAAIHDAYGKAHGLNCFHTYGPEFMNHDLAHYLGPEYKGEYPNRYIRSEPKERMPLCHLISAVDPIEAADNTKPIRDGLPETLPEWIAFNGLKYFKIKLNGDDLKWDVERVLQIDRVTTATQQKIFVAGGDMSCPGAALIQTASLQARVPGVTSVEANARQFLPAANRAWEARFPGMFRITDGMMQTSELNQVGLGV